MRPQRCGLGGVTVLALSLASAAASANLRPLTDGRARAGTGSWEDVVRPERRDARLLVRQGLALLLDARSAQPDDGLEPPSQLQIERALERFDRALEGFPDDPEIALYRGLALADFVREEAGGRTTLRTAEAVAELERTRALDASYEPAVVAWQLALLYGRERRYDDAAREYERCRAGVRGGAVPIMAVSTREEALYLMFAPPGVALIALNQAEAEMLGGSLAQARAHYDESIAASPVGSVGRALALMGRALVEERSGAHLEALATAELAATAWNPRADDPLALSLVARHGAVAALHVPGVSFEPRWERHAYEALVHEALAQAAQRQGQPERVQSERERARRSLRAFFTSGGGESRFAEVARAGMARLEEVSR